MARLWSCGFELGSATSGIEYDSSISTPVVQNTTKRSGTYAFQVISLSSGVAKGARRAFVASANNGPFFFRRCLRIATLPSAANRILFWNDSDNQTSPMFWIVLNSDGTLGFHDEDGQVGSNSSALSTNTWYRIEVKYDRTAAAGSHVLEAKIDGTSFASASNRDISSGIFIEGWGGNLNSEAQTQGEWYFDDFADNDGTGSFQNSYPGEGEIIHLRPNAAGDNAAWALGTGSTFAEVDEVTPDDATTYIAANTATGVDATDVSEFELDATPAALASNDIINVVQVGYRVTLSDATGADPAAILRIKSASGGTVEESAGIQQTTTSWNTNGQASPKNYKLTLYDLPGASTTPWSKSTLDTAQIGVRLTVTDTHNVQVTALWLLVDHKPAGGHTVTITQVIETESVQAFTQRKIKTIGQVNETDTPQLFSPQRKYGIAQVSELNSAQAITFFKVKTLGLVVELNAAQLFTAARRYSIAQVLETDLAQAMGNRKSTVVGQVNELNIAQALSKVKRLAATQVVEINLSQAIAIRKSKSIGLVNEIDTSQSLSTAVEIAIGQVTEIDLAQVFIRRKSRSIDQVSENNIAQNLNARKILVITQVSETDLAHDFFRQKHVALVQVLEGNLAQAFISRKLKVIGQVIEENTALPFILVASSNVVDAILRGRRGDQLIGRGRDQVVGINKRQIK